MRTIAMYIRVVLILIQNFVTTTTRRYHKLMCHASLICTAIQRRVDHLEESVRFKIRGLILSFIIPHELEVL